jgi:hypothetical protein
MVRSLVMCFFIFLVSGQILHCQPKDTVTRDVGIYLGWQSLLVYPETATAADIVRYLQLGAEVKIKRFWLQTYFAIGWSRHRKFEDDFNVDVTISAPYQIKLLKGRAYFGVGPIFNYFVHRSEEQDWARSYISESHAFALGVMVEFTVPIWNGLSLESASDIGPAFGFSPNGQTGIGIRINRLVSFGINYRFKSGKL